jgi:hypothetical protein
MIKATLYLPNGKYVSVFIKRRQYKLLGGGPKEMSVWWKIKSFFKKAWKKYYKRGQRGSR